MVSENSSLIATPLIVSGNKDMASSNHRRSRWWCRGWYRGELNGLGSTRGEGAVEILNTWNMGTFPSDLSVLGLDVILARFVVFSGALIVMVVLDFFLAGVGTVFGWGEAADHSEGVCLKSLGKISFLFSFRFWETSCSTPFSFLNSINWAREVLDRTAKMFVASSIIVLAPSFSIVNVKTTSFNILLI